MKVVLDTNALLVCVGKRSPFRPIFDALLSGRYNLCVSNDILLEYEEILTNRASAVVAQNILNLLLVLRNVSKHEIHYYWWMVTYDPDDNKFVDCYITAGAEYLVTNDHHFEEVKKLTFPPVNIISIEDFLKLVTII